MAEGNAAKLMDLFVGSQTRSYRHVKTSGPGELIKWQFTGGQYGYGVEDVRKHLAGEVGLALVPELPDNKVRFAVMDIDKKGEIVPIAKKIEEEGWPLVACQSKRGGVHVYYFLPQEEDAGEVDAAMRGWATDLGHSPEEPGVVVRSHNCILLPYFHADKTDRYAYNRGRKLDFDSFVALARHKREEA